jgi:hypothetical protein
MRHTAAPAPMNPRRVPPPPGVTFEYTGSESVSVVGSVTGSRYEFRGYGARMRVDLRDRSQLLRTPGLRLVL